MWKRRRDFAIGLFFVLEGSYALLYCYAFSSLVDPSVVGWNRSKITLARMFNPSDGGMLTLFSLVVFGGGLRLMWNAIKSGK